MVRNRPAKESPPYRFDRASLQSPSMRRYFPTIASSCPASRDAEIIPVYRQLLADRLTPVTRLRCWGATTTHFCWKAWSAARRSPATASSPPRHRLVYQVAGGQRVDLAARAWGGDKEFETTDPLADLQKLLPHAPLSPRQQTSRLSPAAGRVCRIRHDSLLRGRKAATRRRRMTASCRICCSGCTANW